MTYERFEDLPVWQQAVNLYELVSKFLESTKGISSSFKNQLERAALSVSNNIAEGFERGTTRELLAFIYIARGSAGEVRSMLCILERKFPNLKSEILNLKSTAESCSRQLRAWAESLQNSDITGTRHLNDKVKTKIEARKKADEFEKKLKEMLPIDHPLRANP